VTICRKLPACCNYTLYLNKYITYQAADNSS
jgi:hypothetical protein